MSTPEPSTSEPNREPAVARGRLQERVARAILDAAAEELARAGERASMNDVAAAAGVARATVYRYFPSRQALLDSLAEVAVHEASRRLAASRIDEVPVGEAIVRTVRALVETGDAFIVVALERRREPGGPFDTAVVGPLRGVVERGRAERVLRDDVPAAWLAEALVALTCSLVSASPALGRDDAVATITDLFLAGARTRPGAV
jgi:TetR/AcrR family transcriptional repressor of mexCD-oprJ operon